MKNSYLRPVADINPTQPITTTVLTFCKSTTKNQRFVRLPLIHPKTLVLTSLLGPRANQCPYILSRLVVIVTGILYILTTHFYSHYFIEHRTIKEKFIPLRSCFCVA